MSGPKYRKWINDLKIMQSRLPDSCPIKEKLNNNKYYEDSSVHVLGEIIGILESINDWEKSIGVSKKMNELKKYDVFLSHADKDKLNYVDEFYEVLRKLGISIFYDSDSISWGDNFKQAIIDGTKISEFAIIIISENFFDREWTELELKNFLTRQNETGQKIVLPLLYDISIEKMKEKYPSLEEIQVIETNKYTKEEIVILFAKELIKRIKS